MLGLAALLQAVVGSLPADAIRPPLDTVMRQISEEVRDDGRTRRTFRIERDVVFAAEPDGFRATVTLRTASATASPLEVENYRAANARMIDRPVVVRLDRAGRLRSVDDLPAVWTAWTDGLAATRPSRSSPEGETARERLRTLPNTRIAAMLGSMVTELVAPPAERVAVPSRPVSLASPPPFAAVVLTGTSRAVAEGDRLRIHVAAAGDHPGARIVVTANRLVDLTTGLFVTSARTEKMSAPGLSLTVTSTKSLLR